MSKQQSHTWSYYHLREALAQPDCPLCRLRRKTARQYLDSLLWESVNDEEVRRQIRRAHGFCPEHAAMLARPGSALGVAIVSNDVVRHLLRALDEASYDALPPLSLRRVREGLRAGEPASATAALAEALAPEAPCPACRQADEHEALYLDAFLEHLPADDEFRDLFFASDGLCLPHLRQALARVRGRPAFQALVDGQRAIWQRLAAELEEQVRKSDWRFHDEPPGDESGAWLRALAALSGALPDET
ncbi:MAG: DUF6062 family protein [Anaerolineae bacterium]